MMPRPSPVLLLGFTLVSACGRRGLGGDTRRDSGSSPDALPQGPDVTEPAYRESTERFVRIAAGYSETCGLRSDGSIRCWGVYGDCRDVASECPSEGGYVPYVPKPAAGRWKRVSVGQTYVCALREDDSIDCWGEAKYIVPHIDGSFSTLSDSYAIETDSGNIVALASFAKQPPAGSFISASGHAYNCGIRSDGSLACWGSARTDGVTDPPPDGAYTQLAVTNYFGCAVRVDGELICWGWGTNAWSTDSHFTPQPDGAFAQIAANGDWACGVRKEGTLACWGWLNGYQPPPGSYVQVAVGLTSQTGPDWGGTYFCALRTDGIVVCWGGNNHGESSPP